MEITTFHSFAWNLVRRWGSAIGLSNPKLVSPSEAKLFGAEGGLTYDDLLPLALKLLDIPAIRKHMERRWAVIACDEFQDTSGEQFELLLRLRGGARFLLLGDLNQCIYSMLPGAIGVGPGRVEAALALPKAGKIQLPDVSHRDPTNVLPAAAAAIRQRDFQHDAVTAALRSGKLEIRRYGDPAYEGGLVTALVGELRAAGHASVAIFSHHVDATASLSDHLNRDGISHEIVGLPDTITSALQAQFEMLAYAAHESSFDAIRRALGVFITSTERGSGVPGLARMVVGHWPATETLVARLEDIDAALRAAKGVTDVLNVVAQMPASVGLARGMRAWARSATILRALLGPRRCRMTTFPSSGLDELRSRLTEEQVSLLTYTDAEDAVDVQLMGLYQSKGREADATIVVLRGNDFYGKEPEPMPAGSRLLYVVLTRARAKTIVLTLGSPLPPLIYPLATLSSG